MPETNSLQLMALWQSAITDYLLAALGSHWPTKSYIKIRVNLRLGIKSRILLLKAAGVLK
jgi:hypothetical protein